MQQSYLSGIRCSECLKSQSSKSINCYPHAVDINASAENRSGGGSIKILCQYSSPAVVSEKTTLPIIHLHQFIYPLFKILEIVFHFNEEEFSVLVTFGGDKH